MSEVSPTRIPDTSAAQEDATDRDGDQFRITVDRPAGMSAEDWEQAKQRISAGTTPVVSDALGRCLERDWCALAGHEDHEAFHASETVELVPVSTPGGEAAVGAWLSERRDGCVRLIVDAQPGMTDVPIFDLDPGEAALFATVLVDAPADAVRRLVALVGRLDDDEVAGR